MKSKINNIEQVTTDIENDKNQKQQQIKKTNDTKKNPSCFYYS